MSIPNSCLLLPLSLPLMITRCAYLCFNGGASLVAQPVKNLPAMQKTWVQSLGQEDPLGKGMATHSSIFAWRIPWTEETGGLPVHGVTKSWTRLCLMLPAHISEEADLLIRSTLVGPCLCYPSHPILSGLELVYSIHRCLVTTWLDCSPAPPPLPLLTSVQVLEFS